MRKFGLLTLLGLCGAGIVWLVAQAQERPKVRVAHELLGDATGEFVAGIAGRSTEEVRPIVDGRAQVSWGEGGKIGLFAKGLPEGGGRTVLPVAIVLQDSTRRLVFAAEAGSIMIEDIQMVVFEVPGELEGEFEVRVGVRGRLSEARRMILERY